MKNLKQYITEQMVSVNESGVEGIFDRISNMSKSDSNKLEKQLWKNKTLKEYKDDEVAEEIISSVFYQIYSLKDYYKTEEEAAEDNENGDGEDWLENWLDAAFNGIYDDVVDNNYEWSEEEGEYFRMNQPEIVAAIYEVVVKNIK